MEGGRWVAIAIVDQGKRCQIADASSISEEVLVEQLLSPRGTRLASCSYNLGTRNSGGRPPAPHSPPRRCDRHIRTFPSRKSAGRRNNRARFAKWQIVT